MSADEQAAFPACIDPGSAAAGVPRRSKMRQPLVFPQGIYHKTMNNLSFRAVRAALFGFIWFFAVIFIPAWTLNYWQGWAFFLTLAIFTSLATIYMALHDKKLLESRLNMGSRAEKTLIQKVITAIGAPVFVASIVIMVFDHRFGWSPAVPGLVSIFGDALVALGILIYFFVVKENRYAAATVEVVEGQTVVSTGLYALIRHPMYTGAILVLIGMPIALGSWWGLLFEPFFIAGFAWRLLHEEKFLSERLSGYSEYMHKVRYRLVPYIW
jgi:protein-S-isoprenylcysteine O-methyltransferase Ste14